MKSLIIIIMMTTVLVVNNHKIDINSFDKGYGYVVVSKVNANNTTINKLENANQLNEYDNYLGVSFYIQKSDLRQLKDLYDLKKVDSYAVGEKFIEHYYSTKLSKCKTINNSKTNIQICYDGQSIKIGYPLIVDML